MGKCPYCGHANTGEQDLCTHCGTELTPGQRKANEPPPQTLEETVRLLAKNRMRSGARWCIGGIIVTGLTYLYAVNTPGGGTYFIAWGAIAFGAVRFLQGLFGGRKLPSTEDFGYEALACATRLETQGQLQAALAGYQKIVETYPDTSAGKDAQKSLDSLRAKIG